jgi:hypothetical protein
VEIRRTLESRRNLQGAIVAYFPHLVVAQYEIPDQSGMRFLHFSTRALTTDLIMQDIEFEGVEDDDEGDFVNDAYANN